MKEKVLDVLMYLFDNYMDDGQELEPDQDALIIELSRAGFPQGEISKAFTWLEELSDLRETLPAGIVASNRTTSFRYFSPDEFSKLDRRCRGFLLALEQRGVIDPMAREMVLDRVMALEEDEIDLEQLKWVILMVLFNQSGQEHAYTTLEELVVNERQDCLQ
jgi:Smg protein